MVGGGGGGEVDGNGSGAGGEGVSQEGGVDNTLWAAARRFGVMKSHARFSVTRDPTPVTCSARRNLPASEIALLHSLSKQISLGAVHMLSISTKRHTCHIFITRQYLLA